MDNKRELDLEDKDIVDVEDGTSDLMDSYWEQVPYHYASYAQVVGSPIDMRILFGERLPPVGKVRPDIGIVMSLFQAKAIHKALGIQLRKVDEMIQEHLAANEKSAPQSDISKSD